MYLGNRNLHHVIQTFAAGRVATIEQAPLELLRTARVYLQADAAPCSVNKVLHNAKSLQKSKRSTKLIVQAETTNDRLEHRHYIKKASGPGLTYVCLPGNEKRG